MARTVCVTGATGFVGAHVVRALVARGDHVRAGYRNPKRLGVLDGLDVEPVAGEVLDMDAMRRAIRGCDVLFHVAGFVASEPADRVWKMNASSPLLAVEAAALEGVPRVVLTSTISAVGPAHGEPATEDQPFPEGGTGLVYADSKQAGERAALEAGERLGVDVVVVNPAYVLGVPIRRDQPGETSTRIVANFLRGRLPAVIDAPMNFVDVADVADGHLLAAEHGRAGERYILGGHNRDWATLIDMVARAANSSHSILVIPREVATVGRLRERLGLPGAISAEAYDLMAQDWRFSSAKARRELGYRARPLRETVEHTTRWHLDLLEQGAFDESSRSVLSFAAEGVQLADAVGLLWGPRLAQRVIGRRLVAGR